MFAKSFLIKKTYQIVIVEKIDYGYVDCSTTIMHLWIETLSFDVVLSKFVLLGKIFHEIIYTDLVGELSKLHFLPTFSDENKIVKRNLKLVIFIAL